MFDGTDAKDPVEVIIGHFHGLRDVVEVCDQLGVVHPEDVGEGVTGVS